MTKIIIASLSTCIVSGILMALSQPASSTYLTPSGMCFGGIFIASGIFTGLSILFEVLERVE